MVFKNLLLLEEKSQFRETNPSLTELLCSERWQKEQLPLAIF